MAVGGGHASLSLCGPSDVGCQDAEGHNARRESGDFENARYQRDVGGDSLRDVATLKDAGH